MKRSPPLLSRYPPSPRTPSVISTPAPATPVGWNCQNSMSSRGIPARAAIPRPSPVLMKALVVDQKIRPAPPVANRVARACRIITSPVSISSAVTPSAWPPGSRMRSSAIHSTKNWVRARTFLWYSVCSIACPVRSAAQQERCTGPPRPRRRRNCAWRAPPLYPPEDLHRPYRVVGERQKGQNFEREPDSGRFDVVHQNVAHAHPGVQHDAQRKQAER